MGDTSAGAAWAAGTEAGSEGDRQGQPQERPGRPGPGAAGAGAGAVTQRAAGRTFFFKPFSKSHFGT